jgi:hypothetical protein
MDIPQTPSARLARAQRALDELAAHRHGTLAAASHFTRASPLRQNVEHPRLLPDLRAQFQHQQHQHQPYQHHQQQASSPADIYAGSFVGSATPHVLQRGGARSALELTADVLAEPEPHEWALAQPHRP